MRRTLLIALAVSWTLTACASARHATAADATTVPLSPCETRAVQFGNAQVTVSANADGTPASIAVSGAPTAQAVAAARGQAQRAFGPVRRDTQTIAHQSKWGLVTWTDGCGHPLHDSSSAFPAR